MKFLNRNEILLYVKEKLPSVKIIYAKKIGNTYAVPGNVGEKVITYSIASNGNEIVESVREIKLDSITNKPSWILTKLDKNNKPIVNNYGHLNQYVVEDSVFNQTYEPVIGLENIYSKSLVESFFQVDEDLHFETKYGEIIVMKNGFIKVTDLSRISGISQIDFYDTYVIVNEPNPLIKKLE